MMLHFRLSSFLKLSLIVHLLFFTMSGFSQTPSIVNFEDYVKLVNEVKAHRAERMVTTEKFYKMSQEKNVVILDTRSEAMYKAKHIKGAIHLNFSDFTTTNLAKLIPDKNTKILIYCNNNIKDDQVYFPTKSYTPPVKKDPITLALNIPTYINLFGYGYKNVYELSELISIFNTKIKFEGTAVPNIDND